MRTSTLLTLLAVPGIVVAQDLPADLASLVKSHRARLEAYQAKYMELRASEKSTDTLKGFFTKDIKACKARLAHEQRPDIREVLAVALRTYAMMASPTARTEEEKNLPSLNGIPALSPAWAISPRMLALAAHEIKDAKARDAFMDLAAAKHPDPEVRRATLFTIFYTARREKQPARWEPAYATLTKDFPGSQELSLAQKDVLADSAVQVGQPAPRFDIPSLEDPSIHLTNVAFKGKFLLVDFWATWCVPCVAGIPTMDKLYGEYKERGLEIMSIADEKGPEPVVAFRKKPGMAMPWNHAVCIFDRKSMKRLNPISDAFGIKELPTLILVGPDGRVLAKGEELHSDLGKVLARFLPAKGAVNYDLLEKERDGISTSVRGQMQAYYNAKKSVEGFKPNFGTALQELRAKRTAAQGELKEAYLVLEFAVAAQFDEGKDIRASILKEVPPESAAWNLDWDDGPVLDKILGEEAKPYQAAMKAKGIPDVRAAFGVTEFRQLQEAGRMEEADRLLATLVKDFPENDWVKQSAASMAAERKTEIGKPIPGFSIQDLDHPDQTFTPASFKGKYLLLDFWGTWCTWCVKELPTTHKLYETYKGRGLEILSLAADTKPELVKEFRKKPGMPMPWKHGFLGHDRAKPHAMLEAFGIQGFPTLFLLGPDGKVLAKGMSLRDGNLEKTLEKFIPRS